MVLPKLDIWYIDTFMNTITENWQMIHFWDAKGGINQDLEESGIFPHHPHAVKYLEPFCIGLWRLRSSTCNFQHQKSATKNSGSIFFVAKKQPWNKKWDDQTETPKIFRPCLCLLDLLRQRFRVTLPEMLWAQVAPVHLVVLLVGGRNDMAIYVCSFNKL